MLFQNGVLVDSLSVSENIALALQAAGHNSGAVEVKKYLELVKLDVADMHKMPGQVFWTAQLGPSDVRVAHGLPRLCRACRRKRLGPRPRVRLSVFPLQAD